MSNNAARATLGRRGAEAPGRARRPGQKESGLIESDTDATPDATLRETGNLHPHPALQRDLVATRTDWWYTE